MPAGSLRQYVFSINCKEKKKLHGVSTSFFRGKKFWSAPVPFSPLHVPTRGIEATTLPKCREGGSRNRIAASQLDKGNLANTETWPRALYPPEEAARCPQPLPLPGYPRGGAGDALGPGLTPAVEAVQGTGGTGSSRGVKKHK